MAKLIIAISTFLLLAQAVDVQGETLAECIRDLKDYTRGDYEWIVEPWAIWKYAASTDQLPEIFQGKLNGTGIFYSEGADFSGYNFFIRDAEAIPTVTPGYLYVKYYLYTSNDSRVDLVARPAKSYSNLDFKLPYNSDFQWEEQLIEIDVEAADSGLWVGIKGSNMADGDYLLVDTIALIQGEVLNAVADAANLCTPAPSETLAECVRDINDYNRGDYDWVGYPAGVNIWKYAASSDQLPEIFQGKLNGSGIFYSESAEFSGTNLFIRDAEAIPTVTPGYLYIKYYLCTSNDSKVDLIARPAKSYSNLNFKLPYNSDFQWEEQLIEIDVEAAVSGFWVGIKGSNMADGDYLLVDTIALIQGEVLNTAADAGTLCSHLPPASARPRSPKLKASKSLL